MSWETRIIILPGLGSDFYPDIDDLFGEEEEPWPDPDTIAMWLTAFRGKKRNCYMVRRTAGHA